MHKYVKEKVAKRAYFISLSNNGIYSIFLIRSVSQYLSLMYSSRCSNYKGSCLLQFGNCPFRKLTKGKREYGTSLLQHHVQLVLKRVRTRSILFGSGNTQFLTKRIQHVFNGIATFVCKVVWGRWICRWRKEVYCKRFVCQLLNFTNGI